jgi:drug/metabolite transporter (DMT)-like permease
LVTLTNTLLGIGLTLLGTAINNFGIVIQKHRVNFHQNLSASNNIQSNPNYLKDIWWDLGIFMQVVLCVPFFLMAVGYIGITLAQPLSNAGVIFLVFGLVWGIHEQLHRIEWVGVVLLIFGMISIGIGGVDGVITFEIFQSSKSQFYFRIYIIISLVLLFICIILGKTVPKILPSQYGFASGICYALVSLGMQLISLNLTDQLYSNRFMYLGFGLLYVIGGTICAIYLTQTAFKQSQAINIIPFAQIPMNFLPVFAGLFIFGQTLQNSVFFIGGLILIILATSFLARFQN